MAKLLIIVSLLSLTATCRGFSGGAPEGVCDDMTPKHPVSAQTSRFPYKITLDKEEVKAGDEVSIYIGGKSFKGFFLQVRDGNKKAVGNFLIPANNKYFKGVNCHGTRGVSSLLRAIFPVISDQKDLSAATHKNSIEKENVSLIWKAPAKSGKYTVYATVAQDGGTFWVAQPSGIIKVA